MKAALATTSAMQARPAQAAAALLALLALQAQPGLAAPATAPASTVPVGAPASTRSSQPELLATTRFDNPAATLEALRSRHEGARLRGDRHAEWVHLAALTRAAPTLDYAASEPLLTLAEQALEAAQRAGDLEAAFELVHAVQWTRLAQAGEPSHAAHQSRAAALAQELGDSWRESRVWQLEGLAAAQRGQFGEGLFQLQRALPLARDLAERAELLLVMAQLQIEVGTEKRLSQARQALDELDTLVPPQRHPAFVDALVLRSRLATPGEPAHAVTLARRAALIARQGAQVTPLARAQVALGHAHLAQGNPQQAVASFEAVDLGMLNPVDRLACLSGLALALAQSGEGRAVEALARAESLAQAQSMGESPAVARLRETASRVHEAMGRPDAALDDLAAAVHLHLAMADGTRETLVPSLADMATHRAEASAAFTQEILVRTAALVLAIACGTAGVLCLKQSRQRQRLAKETERLRAETARLQRHNADRSEQLASACHDLRQPAQVLELLTAPTPSPVAAPQDDADEQWASVRRCSRTLIDMLDALTAMSQMEIGHYAPRLEAVALGELLKEVDLQYRHAALAKGLSWQVGTSTELVFSDRLLLQRMLFKLAASAVRCTAEGGVHVLAGSMGEQVFVEIADSGPGLPAGALQGATDPASTPASAAGGGLAMVRWGCALLQHDVSVPLSSPRGSVVRIAMARAQRGLRAAEPAPASAPAIATPSRRLAAQGGEMRPPVPGLVAAGRAPKEART